MSKPLYACPVCGEDFTRKSSAIRHVNNMHEGRYPIVRYIDYIAGRKSGQYPPPLTPSRLLRRKNKTVADNSRGEISYADGFESNNRSEHQIPSPTTTNPLRNPVIEAVHNLIDVEKIYSRLQPGINVYTLPHIGIAKPSWLRAFICDLCLSVPIEAIWNIVYLTKVNHICDPKVVMVVKPLAEDNRKALQRSSFRCLADVVNYWIGDTDVYLKAEELLPTESYDFVTAADTPPAHGGYINLGVLKENHWADRVVKVDKKKSLATGAVPINKDELADFLGIAMATFGIFRVKMPDGGKRDFLMYIVRGLESCKFNHLRVIGAKSSNINGCNNDPKHTDLHNVIQFVNGGAILRLDKLDSTSKKNLSVHIQEWSENHAGHLPYSLSGRIDANHLKDLVVNSSNINNSNNTSQHTDVDNVIQFVNDGPPGNIQGVIFRFDMLYSGYQKNLRQIEDG